MKKAIVSLIGVGAVVLLGLLGRAAIGSGSARGVRRPDLARAVRGDISTAVKSTGVIRPAVGAEVRVGAQISGVLRRMRVRVGDRVAKGQLLAELERRALAARSDQAEASVGSAAASLRFARADLERKAKLAAAQAAPQSELDQAERAVALAEAAVAEANANLAFARVQLDEARVVAPIDGVVASIAVQEGEAVAAGSAALGLLTLVDLQRLEVWAYVDETDIGRIRTGQRVRFGVDTYPDSEFEGEIIAIHPKPEIRDNVVDYIAVVRFAPPNDRTLRPEMTANVRIALDAHEGVLVVPRRAVRREQGRSYVLCPQAAGFARRLVTVGARDEVNVEIVQGLGEGEEVLTSDMPAGGAPTE